MNSKLSIAGLTLACVACCAPLLVPLLAGTGAAIGLAAVPLDMALCIVVSTLVLAGVGIWLALRRRMRSGCGCKDSCNAASNCG